MRALALLHVLVASAALGQSAVIVQDAKDPTKKATLTTVGSKQAMDVNVASSTASADGKILDGTAAGQADVIGSAPAGTEQALVVRNIPSGTQTVSVSGAVSVTGTFWQATQPVSGTVAISTGFLLDTTFTGRINTLGQKLMAASTPVVIASDQSTLPIQIADQLITVTVAGSVTSNAGTGNFSENLAQVGGTGVSTAAAGIQKVGVVGGAGVVLDAPVNSSPAANVVVIGASTLAQGSQPTTFTTGTMGRILASTEGVQFVQEGNSNRFSCVLQGVTVMTQCQAAPASGLRAYVTSAHLSNQAATVQTLDVVFGGGTNCATSPTALTHKWQMGTNATTTSPQSVEATFTTPLVPNQIQAICVRPSQATAFGATITGFIAP